MKEINFIFGVHNHQPIGNFDFVFEEALNKAYKPFFDTLERHPSIKVMAHFSGCLIDWLENHHPEYFDLIAKLHDRGQTEIMGSGYYEPIFPMIPEHDRQTQIKMMRDYLQHKFGASPEGIWLTERVWEPHLAKSFAKSGTKFIVVDDYHLKCAGLKEEEIDGYYITEDEGYPISIFPINENLRYKIPFAPPEETIEYLRGRMNSDNSQLVVMIDDGEKFGIWPGTYEHVYENGWLERFFQLLEQNSEWLKMRLCSEYSAEVLARRLIHLPNNAYHEMGIWSLPPERASEIEALQKEIDSKGENSHYKAFLRGGFWRGFFAKYPEMNMMQKWMLDLSYKAEAALKKSKGKESVETAKKHILAGQCNCPYWHGVFGGLYLPHLRHAVFEELTKASTALGRIEHGNKPFIDISTGDIDCDGQDEITVRNQYMSMVLKPSYGGSIVLLEYKEKSFNFQNTLSRKYEHYHDSIIQTMTGYEEGMSIHERHRDAPENIREALLYDRYLRYSLLDHFFDENITAEQLNTMTFKEQGNFTAQPYNYRIEELDDSKAAILLDREDYIRQNEETFPVKIQKKLEVNRSSAIISATYTYHNLSSGEILLRPGIEWNLFFLGGEDSAKSIQFDEGALHSPLNQTLSVSSVNSLKIKDERLGFQIELSWDASANCCVTPIRTVSQSEGGFDLIYQGTSFIPIWHFSLKPEEKFDIHMKFKISSW